MPPPPHKIECLLLTWHGTLLCSAQGTGALCHKPLTNPDALRSAIRLTVHTALDPKFAQLLPLADGELPYESTLLGDGIAAKASSGHGFNFPRGTQFLCATEQEHQVAWNREHAGTWESFLPVPVDLLTRLASLSARDWTDLASGERILGRDIAFTRDFRLTVGQLDLDLAKSYPTFFLPLGTLPHDDSAQVVFVVSHGEQVVAFASANARAAPAPTRFWLRNAEFDQVDTRSRHPSKPMVETIDPPQLTSAARLYYPPTFAHRDDRKFFIEKYRNGTPWLGFRTSKVSIHRESNCHLVLGREVEGVVFDTVGVRRCYGFMGASLYPPKELLREGDRFFLDRQTIDAAPLLAGNYMIFYNGNLQNYFHWMVEGMVSLYMLHKLRAGDCKIVLPAALGQAANLPYIESLKLLGFADVELTFSSSPVVRLERATWASGPDDLLEEMPPHILVEFQSQVAASLGATAARERLYIERESLRKVANAAEVREFLERAGFRTIRLEGMPLVEQVRLFASAQFVVGPHGAGLSNLLFTPPSARVLEFMPDTEMRPFFWLISSKLGHEYGMLPCETHNGSFNGDLKVDMRKLAKLLALLEDA